MKVSLLKNSKMGLVVLVLLSVSFLTVFAQTSLITVTTDKPTYSDGSMIVISGSVTDQLNIPISIIIKLSWNRANYSVVYASQCLG